MCRLVVDVYKCAPDVGQHFNLILELLTDVMRPPQWGVCVHYYVDFDVVIRSALHRGRILATR